MEAITAAAKNLGIHLVQQPLATSEPIVKPDDNSGQASRSSLGHHGEFLIVSLGFISLKVSRQMGGSPGLVVKGEDSRGCEFESQCHILD